MPKQVRERWGSRLGVIMAVAGSAVGLGNFLRFPSQAGKFGPGAFMIPYLAALVIVGIPLIWVEWTMGRYGGQFGHSSGPGIFQAMVPKAKFMKYVGALAIFGPLIIFTYYNYIESWTLGYSVLTLFGGMPHVHNIAAEAGKMQSFLNDYRGLSPGSSMLTAYIFYLITFAANITVLYFGLRGGIEKVCNIALPILFAMGIVIAIRVLTLPTPAGQDPAATPLNGLGYLWNQDFSKLKNPQVWLAAAGQVFFTLSVGMGVILTYASYLRRRDDVALSGLTAGAANEFAEVILGGAIVVPAAFVFFGPAFSNIQAICQSGSFNLGFVTMPLIFQQMPAGALFGFMWFFMLFLAGITSSISLGQPAIAFLENDLGLTRGKAVTAFAIAMFILSQPAIWFLRNGVLDDLDFWAANVIIVIGALLEMILFGWVFGLKKGWEEMHAGAKIKVPRIFKIFIKYVTPAFLLIILGTWLYQDWLNVILMKNIEDPANRPYVILGRVGLLLLFILMCVLVAVAWKRHKGKLDITSEQVDVDRAER